MNLEDERLIE